MKGGIFIMKAILELAKLPKEELVSNVRMARSTKCPVKTQR